ncbi:hypothetical protein ACOMHN_020033 [Nucella lapillus]
MTSQIALVSVNTVTICAQTSQIALVSVNTNTVSAQTLQITLVSVNTVTICAQALQIALASGSLWTDDVVRYLIDFGWGPVEDGDFVPSLYHPDGAPLPLTRAFTGSLMLGANNNEGALLET